MSNIAPSLTILRKNLKKDATGLTQKRVAILGDEATQLLVQAITGYGIDQGIYLNIWEGDYDQIDLQIHDPGSDFYLTDPEFVLIHKSTAKLWAKYATMEAGARSGLADQLLAAFAQYAELINARTQARIILSNFPEQPDLVFGNFANKTEYSFLYQIRKLNLGLMDLAQRYENVFINDVAALQHRIGKAQALDRKVWINASMSGSMEFVPQMAKNVVDIIQAVNGKFKKCLILDLDNTTWGGIIGDDGMEGIQIGNLGLGKAFTELQRWAKNLKERGIILAICSKNTESVAKVPFEAHPDMVLRLSDLAMFVANWENKADNIRYIQQVLNIGFDSMVFLDDNPFERNLVRTELPAVTVPELPEDPAEYLPYLEQLNLFETASYSQEDAKRTKKYQQEAQRNQLKQNFGSIDEFLQGLNMKGSFKAFDSFHIPRIAQLTQRSNQFNLRTVRYDEQQVRQMMKGNGKKGFYIKLEDKFGEYGLISLLIVEASEGDWKIDTWIMSCRVLKRGVEKFALNQLVEAARQAGVKRLLGEYLPTAKNALVKDHYKELGFQGEGQNWSLEVASYEAKAHFIQEEA
ncbi:MAG: HAD-IIIC family phosphatase [Bacteroidota bacterium]